MFMTSRSKIVGITRHQPVDNDIALDGDDHAISLESAEGDGEHLIEAETSQAEEVIYDDWQMDDNVAVRDWKPLIIRSILLLMVVGWTGFFGWTHYQEAIAGITSVKAVGWISVWALPVCLIGIAWLLLMRNSHAEASRFGDVANRLRDESVALEQRMRTVNEEIALARAFLAQNAQELENIGRHSAQRLTQAAEQLGAALADSDAKAKTLEEVSNAATTNMEQLRKHLPVVTSAAKDVTNQIGSAGNCAQVHVKSLIGALQRVADAGATARTTVTETTEQAEASSFKLMGLVEQSTLSLSQSIEGAEQRSAVIAANLGKATSQVDAALTQTGQKAESMFAQSAAQANNLLSKAAQTADALLTTSSQNFEALIADSGNKLSAQMAEFNAALDQLKAQSCHEDERLQAMMARISAHIEETSAHIADVDAVATERTARLAFSVEALVHSTKELNDSMGDNHKTAETLVERAERLLLALDTANREIDESLPAALTRIDDRLIASLAHIDAVHQKSGFLDDYSDNMLSKVATLQNLVEQQKHAVDALMLSSDDHFTARTEQAEALSETLVSTKQLIADMTENADSTLVSSLLRVRDTAHEAAESSRQILDEQLGTVASRLTEQNRAILASAVEDQVQSLDNILKESIERNIAASEASTQKISAQLAVIDEMTVNLEQRLSDTHSSFAGIDEDSFARQMVMLTEALNSTAIDVAKILSNEVTDTAWAAYLKGDRGVFTRRAVKLLDAGEARAIALHYGEDAEFREHVNRYIHDFEAMMRVLLSTRDGNAIGVTLLSSDVGKLYVALAQAIERLRN
jgi:hypothetical protein